jgi:hypothetical protein
MSRKLSTIRGADTFQTATPLLIRLNDGSESTDISGIGADGSAGHNQTSPYFSVTPMVDRFAFGGIGTPSSADGTSLQRPPPAKVQPW